MKSNQAIKYLNINMIARTDRLFFSLKFSASQQQQLLLYQQQAIQHCAGAKPVAADNLHLTLFFLGQVDAAQQQSVLSAARQVAMPVFDLTLDTLAGFTKPKILYLAPAVIPAELLGLQQRLADICKALGFNEIHDRYRPHVTLLRHAAVPDRFNQQVLPLSLTVTEFALYQSVNIDGVVKYLPLHTFTGS